MNLKLSFPSLAFVAAGGLGLLAAILVFSFVPGFPTLGWTLLLLILFLVDMLLVTRVAGSKLNWFTSVLSIFYVVLALAPIINTKDTSATPVLAMLMLNLINISMVHQHLFQGFFSKITHILFFQGMIERISQLIPFAQAGITDLKALRSEGQTHDGLQAKELLKTGLIFLLVGIPVIVVVVSLLSSTSDVFAEWVEAIFQIDNNVWGQFFNRSVIATLFGLLFLSEFTFVFYLHKQRQSTDAQKISMTTSTRHSIGLALFMTILVLNLFYLVFVVAQLSYDFGNLWQLIEDQSITSFSELAVGRFWELIYVSLINIGLLYFANHYRTKDFVSTRAKLKLFSVAWLLFSTLMLIFSALQRLNLYIDGYGFTHKRFNAYLFLPVLTIIVVLLVVNYVRQNNQQIRALIVSLLVGFFVLLYALPTTLVINHINYQLDRAAAIQVFDPVYTVKYNREYSFPRNDIKDYDGLWIADKLLREGNLTREQRDLLSTSIDNFVRDYQTQEVDWRQFNLAEALLYQKLVTAEQ